MIVTRLYGRLRHALPELIPVLLPEQLREPYDAAPLDAQGRPVVGRGERGLGYYLSENPDGYAQIEQPVPITSDGLTGTFWVTVAAIHTSREDAQALSDLVYRALVGWPWSPGPHRELTPAQPEPLQGDVWMVRRTFEAKTLDSLTVG